MTRILIVAVLFAPAPVFAQDAQTQPGHKTELQGPTADLRDDTPALEESPSLLYGLTGDASYMQGCFPSGRFSCMCPLSLALDFEGTFGLTLVPSEVPGLTQYEISNVNWTLHLQQDIEITGSGVYRTGFIDDQPVHEMILELSFNGDPAELFDSGLVDREDNQDLPLIDIAVNMNGLACYDVLIDIVAVPSTGKQRGDT